MRDHERPRRLRCARRRPARARGIGRRNPPAPLPILDERAPADRAPTPPHPPRWIPPSPAGSDGDDYEIDTFLPPFANAENKALDGVVREKQRALDALREDTEENRDRVVVMREHLKNVNQELIYTQSRCDAKKKEMDTEAHMKRMSELAIARVREDVAKMEKEEIELGDKLATLQTEVHKGNEKLDQFKLLMNWNNEELEQWATASAQKEEDNLALLKYQRADEARVKELTLAIEKMTKAAAKKKAALDDEVTDTQAAQTELDRAAEDFRALHAERQDLVRQWEESVENMRRRDEAIQDASRRFAALKKELRLKKSALDERARFYEQEVANNKEVDASITAAERGMAKMRAEYQVNLKEQTDLQDEVDLLNNTMKSLGRELATENTENASKLAAVEAKKQKLESLKRQLARTELRLENEKIELMTLEERSAELDRIAADNADELDAVRKEAAAHKDLMYKTSQELQRLRDTERGLVAEIDGATSQNKNMTQKIAQLDALVVKQQEQLYNAEFQIQALERQVARAGGARSEDETRVLNAKIAVAEGILNERKAEHDVLVASVKKAEDDLETAKRKNKQLKSATASLGGVINELNLEADSVAKAVKAVVKEKEEKMVAHDVLKLEVKRLRDALNDRSDAVFSLENRKFQLQLSMDERKHEVEVHRELLAAQLKMTREDIHRATLEMKERSMRVGKLQTKFEVLVGRVKRPDGPDGAEFSQAYYVIKAAQEREGMQRRGDELDANIRKAEKEVKALETTLGKINQKNNVFRGSIKPVKDDGDDALTERAALREKLDNAYDKMKFKREEEATLQRDLEASEDRMRRLAEEAEDLDASLAELRDDAAGGEDALREAAEAAARSREELREEQEKYRAKAGLAEGEQGLEELDLTCQELREGTRVAVSELKAVAAAHPALVELLAGHGVKLPGDVGGRAASEQSSYVLQ